MTGEALSIRTTSFPSPLGWIVLAATAQGVCLLHFWGQGSPSHAESCGTLGKLYPHASISAAPADPFLESVQVAVLRYLETGVPLPPFPLDMRLGTPFQQRVWLALTQIPFGETRSYLQIAREVGRPLASRAVGQACGRNPVAMLIPCHRVLASSGRLGGYSGGLGLKEALLHIERRGTAGAGPPEPCEPRLPLRATPLT